MLSQSCDLHHYEVAIAALGLKKARENAYALHCTNDDCIYILSLYSESRFLFA